MDLRSLSAGLGMDSEAAAKNRKHKISAMAIVLAAVFVALFLTIACAAVAARNTITAVETTLADRASLYAERISSWCAQALSDISIYKEYITDAIRNKKDINEVIAQSFEKSKIYPYGIYVGDDEGHYFDASGWVPEEDFVVTERPWYKQAKHINGIVVGAPYKDAMLGKTCVSISSKIENSQPLTVMSTDIYLDYPTEVVESITVDDRIDGAILLTANREKVASASSFPSNETDRRTAFENRLLSLVSSMAQGTDHVNLLDDETYVNVRTAKGLNWTLITYVNKGTVLNGIYKTYGVLIGIEITALIALFVMMMSIHKHYQTTSSEVEVRTQINNAFASSYVAQVIISIPQNLFVEIRMSERVRELVGSKNTADVNLEKTVYAFTEKSCIPRMLAFVDLKTVAERLKERNVISEEFLGINEGLCRASIINVARDENGNTTDFLYCIQCIDGEIISLRTQLSLSETLIECIRQLSSNDNFSDSVNKLLATIGNYYAADRVGLFTVDNEEKALKCEYVWNNDSFPPDLMEASVPMFCFKRWFDEFERNGIVWIASATAEVPPSSKEADILAKHQVERIIAAPLNNSDGEILGFIGIANPHQNTEAVLLARSVTTFLAHTILKKQYTDSLYDLSYTDKMTGLLNRHAYIRDSQKLNSIQAEHVGMLFADINGLKSTNDKSGHSAGDELIKKSAALLKDKFPGSDIYRIGGDEFVVFALNIQENQFMGMVHSLLSAIKANPLVSVGEVWLEKCVDIDNQVKIADSRMYKRKHDLYASGAIDRRAR